MSSGLLKWDIIGKLGVIKTWFPDGLLRPLKKGGKEREQCNVESIQLDNPLAYQLGTQVDIKTGRQIAQ